MHKLTPIFHAVPVFSLKDTGSPFSTLSQPPRYTIRGPLVIEISILDSTERRTIPPVDPSYNLEHQNGIY